MVEEGAAAMNPDMRDCLRLPDSTEIAAGSSRLRTKPPRVKLRDPATCVMNDFTRESPWTISADRSLDHALDEMFRIGVRAFLVTEQQQVVGLVTSDDISGARLADLTVADVMTEVSDIPAIDWQTVLEARISDLLEIFEGTGVNHLV